MSKIIALDAGHGLSTAGKRCLKSLDKNETREWFLNDRIIDLVESTLKSTYDCTVIRTDDTTGKKDISLLARVKTANQAKADVFISMHHNAGINGGTGGGTVVYYSSSKAERAGQAQRLYDRIVNLTGLKGNRSQKVIKKGFYVIAKTTMPAFLVENGFMDSKTDVPIILSESHAKRTAEGVVAFLVDMLGLKKKAAQSTPTITSNVYYPAYKGKKDTLSNALKSLGIDNSYSFRKKIAKANSISGYTGTATQNTRMYNMLVAGILKRV